MPPVRRILCIAFLALPPAAHAGGVVVVGSSGTPGFWLALAVLAGFVPPPPAPEVSPHHLSAGPAPAKDSCTFVAGVRHCPLAKPRAESR
jgi:hypothetical protein